MTDTRYDPIGEQPRHHDLSADTAAPEAGPSTLEMLRAAADAEAAAVAEAEAAEPIELYSPGRKIRLTCDYIHAQKQIQDAQRAALPKAEQRKPQPSLFKMNVALVHARLIFQQTRAVALLNGDGVYGVLRDADDEPLDLNDPKLLATFGTADGIAAVRRIFVRDNFLLAAGQELIDASGWGEMMGEGDELDPPEQSRSERRSSTG